MEEEKANNSDRARAAAIAAVGAYVNATVQVQAQAKK